MGTSYSSPSVVVVLPDDNGKSGGLMDDDVPIAAGSAAVATRFQNRSGNNNLSDRSSGVSLFSSGSGSDGSSAISSANRSVSSESLSLSSAVGRISGRSSRSSIIDQQPQSFELYDVPTSNHQVVKEVLPASQAIQEEVYDVPKPAAAVVPDDTLYDVPPPTATSITEDNSGLVYDVPPARTVAATQENNRTISHPTPSEQGGDTYDSPKPLSVDWTDKVSNATLPLPLDAALDTLGRLDTEVSSAITNLQSFCRAASGGDWAELQLRVLRLRASLQELCDFARGAIGNASQRIKNGLGDEGVTIRLIRLLRPLQDANTIVQKTSQSWTDLFTNRLATNNENEAELDQLLACCRNLGDDMRQVVMFIQSNGHLLFDKNKGQTEILNDDYDYVNLESKAKIDQENEEVKRTLPHEMKRVFDVLVAQSEDLPVLPSATNDKVSDNDRNVMEFYGSQAETYAVYLSNAIDAFIVTIERNQPPKVFVAYSKFVILNAHKLLCIGDTVHRNVVNAKLKVSVLERSNQLCQGLQTCVQSTKKAGREFPSVAAVQGMLDSILTVSKLAQNLKTCLVQPTILNGSK
uniref:Putative Breast cancer anti-estrogen resistance 1 protein n=1 Tax=Daphnia magna TaxID=35525 RepID=A0A0P6ENC8_9CRUS